MTINNSYFQGYFIKDWSLVMRINCNNCSPYLQCIQLFLNNMCLSNNTFKIHYYLHLYYPVHEIIIPDNSLVGVLIYSQR